MWTDTFIAAVSVASISALLVLWFLYLTIRDRKKRYWDKGPWPIFAITFFIPMLFIVPLLYPYEGVYHKYTRFDGKVTHVSTRFNDASEQYIFYLEWEGDDEFVCNDTACASITVGDTVNLGCVRVWDYRRRDYWKCYVQ